MAANLAVPIAIRATKVMNTPSKVSPSIAPVATNDAAMSR